MPARLHIISIAFFIVLGGFTSNGIRVGTLIPDSRAVTINITYGMIRLVMVPLWCLEAKSSLMMFLRSRFFLLSFAETRREVTID